MFRRGNVSESPDTSATKSRPHGSLTAGTYGSLTLRALQEAGMVPQLLLLGWDERALRSEPVMRLCLQKPGPTSEAAVPWVGSRIGAPTVGSGGYSTAFAVPLSPAAMVTFAAAATSNVACEFLALRSPACFTPWLMRRIQPAPMKSKRRCFPRGTLARCQQVGQSPELALKTSRFLGLLGPLMRQARRSRGTPGHLRQRSTNGPEYKTDKAPSSSFGRPAPFSPKRSKAAAQARASSLGA